jgi:uncharacterized membrane protein
VGRNRICTQEGNISNINAITSNKFIIWGGGMNVKILELFSDSTVIAVLSYVYILLGHAVAQLVEALLYKPEGRGFDSRWCHCNFSLT